MTGQLLMDNVLACMMEHGYAATSVDRCACAADATRATFYLHFCSKVQLMRSLVELPKAGARGSGSAQLGGPRVAALLALLGLHGSKEQREQLVD
ncbi:TetR/AcrR family transcriptional regulator [Glutamicibacter arilaitensis]|uniref:TetR/AcrR family transcriptional regulator n=1 Tax=Glutamicibacter arilaitensis TaxID=256701 RepID=UPI00384E5C66